MAVKLVEHTYSDHIYMRMMLDNGRIEEIDVFIRESGMTYRTSADPGMELDPVAHNKTRNEIITAFNELY